MPPREEKSDWLGDLRWQGYPRLEPVRDTPPQPPDALPPRPRQPVVDARADMLARENEALRAKIEAMSRLGMEFERRLSETASSYESAALEADSARRSLELECARLAGELESVKAELARHAAQDVNRAAELTLERERRADSERALSQAHRRLDGLEAELRAARDKASELAGAVAELRRIQQSFGEKK
jgi:chromosome segregation ATPase